MADLPDEHHQAISAFLDLLERDIEEHSERLRPIPCALVQRIRRVTRGVEVDLDEKIEGPVAL